MFDIEKYIEQRWSKFYKALDELQNVVAELERLRSQTPIECLPPQSEAAANMRESALSLPLAHRASDDQVSGDPFAEIMVRLKDTGLIVNIRELPQPYYEYFLKVTHEISCAYTVLMSEGRNR